MKKNSIISEYAAAYINAEPVDGSPYRTVVEYGNCELAVAENSGDYEFVTWRKNNGERGIGNYFGNYASAKEDFAKRSGLVDSNKLFDETELAIIRDGLIEYYYVSEKEIAEPRRVLELIEKIEDIITPEVSQESEIDEDEENEFEY